MKRIIIVLAVVLTIIGCEGNSTRTGNTPTSPTIGLGGWGADTRLTSNIGPSYHAFNGRSIAAGDNGIIHVVWYEIRSNQVEILYKRSTNEGQNWGPDVVLSRGPIGVNPETTIVTGEGGLSTFSTPEGPNPAVAVSGSYVHVAWRADPEGAGNAELYYKRSVDYGLTWGNDVRLTNSAYDSIVPSIAASGSRVHIVWVDYRDQVTAINEEGETSAIEELYYKGSFDGGATWTSDRRITTSSAPKGFPEVAALGNGIFVAWMDHREGNWEIYYKISNDENGTSWGNDMRLTNDAGTSEVPAVAISEDDIHIVWSDSRGKVSSEPDAYIDQYEIYYRHSTDGGVSWDNEVCFCTNDGKPSGNPDIAVSGTNVHIVYPDARDANAMRRTAMEMFEIYYKYSPDGGTTWLNEVRLTTDSPNFPYNSRVPGIAVSPSAVHVVWEEHRDGNAEIYYKQRRLD